MFEKLASMFKSMLTEQDAISLCPVKVLSMGLSVPTIVMFVIGYAVSIYQGHFDGQNMALAFCTLCGGIAAVAGGVAVKSLTETK